MPSEIVQLTSCGTAAEADHLLWVLKAGGVPAFVDGANSNAMLSYVGPALGGVKLFIHRDDQEAALQILESALETSTDQTDWFCGECEEHVEGDFELCWSCGKPREEVGQSLPMTSEASSLQTEVNDSPSQAGSMRPVHDAANPYASPGTWSRATDEHSADSPLPPDSPEAILQRAWRASIWGIAFLPIVINFYSMYLLFRAAAATETFSPKQQRLFYFTLLVNLAVSAAWGMVILTAV